MGDTAQASSRPDGEPTQALSADPVLEVISSGELRGRSLVLDRPERTVGRAPSNDLRLDDPYISRHHAVLRRAGIAVLVEDAGSTAGVYVNGQRIDGPALLRPGDVIRIGRIDLQLRTGGDAAARPGSSGHLAAGYEPASNAGARFDVGAQRADVISNVGRDQISYNQYALKFAPLRRRARILIQTGLALVFGGFAIDLVGVIRYLSVFQEWMNLLFSSSGLPPEQGDEVFSQAGDVFSRLVNSAFPLFVTGMAVSLAGLACIVTGLVMRRRAREATR